MYKREFETFLKNNAAPKASFFYGACDYQNNFLTDALLHKLEVQSDEKLSLYFDEYHFATAKNFIAQSSLFGDRNILIIKTDKILPTKEMETLIQLCSKNDSSYLIYQFLGEDKKVIGLTKLFEKSQNSLFVRLFKAEMAEAITLLSSLATQQGVSIDRYVLQHLFQVHMENLSLCANEFEKLSLLNHDISLNDIDTLVYGLGNVSMEQFMSRLFEKKSLAEIFERMVEGGGIEEMRIVNAIEAHLSQLFLFHAYIKMHGSFDSKAILGYALPSPIAQQRSHQSIKIDLATYHKLFELMTHTEYQLKKVNGIEKNALLLSSLIKLQSYL